MWKEEIKEKAGKPELSMSSSIKWECQYFYFRCTLMIKWIILCGVPITVAGGKHSVLAILFIFFLFGLNFESGTTHGAGKYNHKSQLLTMCYLQSRAGRHSNKLHITAPCGIIQQEHYMPDSVLNFIWIILLNPIKFNCYAHFTDKDTESPRDYPHCSKGYKTPCQGWNRQKLSSIWTQCLRYTCCLNVIVSLLEQVTLRTESSGSK